MTPEQVLSRKPARLTQRQRDVYFENGYLLLERMIPLDIIGRLRDATAEKVEKTRNLTKSNAVWDLEAGHSAIKPKLRRLSSPCDHHPAYWDYATHPLLLDIVADLVGPDVKFHHSKLNFKASEGGAEVKWHQDIQFWPHTNYSPLTVGTYLYDCGWQQGPLAVIPGSHNGELFDQYNEKRQWIGYIPEPAWSVEGRLSDGTGRFADNPQLPHRTRLARERVGGGKTTLTGHLFLGRRDALHP
jgi:ectoine hydroxylase